MCVCLCVCVFVCVCVVCVLVCMGVCVCLCGVCVLVFFLIIIYIMFHYILILHVPEFVLFTACPFGQFFAPHVEIFLVLLLTITVFENLLT